MPSGGYGIGEPLDWRHISDALKDETIKKFGMHVEWLAAYVTARVAGADPDEASRAAYTEWDL